jgi:hypothetical protein
MVANYVNDPRLGKENEYAYDKTLGRMLLPVSETVKALPAQVEGEVFFWSADGIKIDLSNAKSDVEIKLTAPMFQLGYDQYNEFSLAVIQSNSRGQVAPKINWMSIRQVKERKTQGGTLKITPDKDFDTAMIVIIGLAPEEVDENVYKKSKGIKYSIAITDSGAAVARAAAAVDSDEIIAGFAAIANDESDSEAAMLIRLSNLEAMNADFAGNLSREIEAGNFTSLDSLLDRLESGEINSDEIRPLVKSAINAVEFQALQNPGNDQLQQKLNQLKSF